MKLRSLVFPVLCLLFGVLVWRNRGQASAFYHVLRGAQILPLMIAVLLQLGTLLNQPALFQSLYTLVGIKARWRDLAPVVLAGRFINVVAPAAGLGETALLFEQARRRGWDLALITLATTLYFAFNFAVFALILAAGLALLAGRGDLQSAEIFAALPLFVALGAGAWLLWQLARQPQRLSSGAQKLIARLPQRWQARLPTPSDCETMAQNFANALRALGLKRANFALATVHAILVDALEIAVLGATLRAFGVPLSPTLIVAGYAVATLFTVVSLTPQGIGVVEGALGATLVSLGVSLPHATAAVLTYRGLSFWLPVLVGFVASRFWTTQLPLAPDGSLLEIASGASSSSIRPHPEISP